MALFQLCDSCEREDRTIVDACFGCQRAVKDRLAAAQRPYVDRDMAGWDLAAFPTVGGIEAGKVYAISSELPLPYARSELDRAAALQNMREIAALHAEHLVIMTDPSRGSFTVPEGTADHIDRRVRGCVCMACAGMFELLGPLEPKQIADMTLDDYRVGARKVLDGDHSGMLA